MRFVRFLKIFGISFGALLAVFGIAVGTAFLSGAFNRKTINPENIAFEKSEYDASEDFQMIISTTTPDTTENKITLSFGSSYTEDNGFITDGIVTVPKYVTIGTAFDVVLNKENKLINGERIAWIKGGISSLNATSTNVSVRVANVSVYVDVPVYSLNLTASTSQNSASQTSFNIGSNFWVNANFVPSESAFKYFKNGSDGKAAEYKTVFFSTLSNFLSKTNNSTYCSQQYNALQGATDVNITGQCFSSIKDELIAFEAVSSYEDAEMALSYILNELDSIIGDKKAEANLQVDFEELVVGSYSVNTVNVPSVFNSSVKIFANKQTDLTNEYNLAVSILANDSSTPLQSEIKRVGIAFAIVGTNGYVPATDSQFYVDSSDFTTASINGQTYKFYFPYLNQININESYWNIVALNENISAKLIVALFDEVQGGYQINSCSLTGNAPKFVLAVDSTSAVSSQIYWNDPSLDTQILYIYDNTDTTKTVYQQYDLKNLEFVMPIENSYKTIMYFAYLEESGGEISSEFVGKYIAVGQNTAKYKVSSENSVTLYELPDGVITPKDADFPEGFVIRVVFASIKTNYDGSYVYGEDGSLSVDRYSSTSSLGTLQTLSFEIQKTLKTIDSYAEFTSENGVLSGSNLAVINGTAEAFDIVFNIPADQQKIFVNDFNEGRIGLRFKINGVEETSLFNYDKNTTFTYDELNPVSSFVLPINIGYITYYANDPGYRNFTIEISYQRGYEDPIYINVISGQFTDNDDETQIANPTFEVYDGKIFSIDFAGDFKNVVTNLMPIDVKTSLSKDTDTSATGIYYAAVGSTNSFTLNGNPFDRTLLFDESTGKVNVIAYDKYGKEITDSTLWTLKCNDETGKILTVDSSGQTLNFLGTSESPIEVWLSSSYGIGGSSKESSYRIYFSVETLGKIAFVATNTTEVASNQTVNYENIDDASFNAVNGTYKLDNEESTFADSSLSLYITGVTGKTFYLNEEGQVNLLKLYYALPATTASEYNIFDLLKITKFVREDGTSFDGFINFAYSDEAETYITSFSIIKDFGQTGYLNLKAITDIGISLSLKIIINPNISAVLGTYGHEAEGAQGGYQNAYNYIGVYSNYKIDLSFTFSSVDEIATVNPSSYKPLLYDASTNSIVAIAGKLTGQNSVAIDGLKVTVSFYIGDVAGITYKHFVFVLASDQSINEQDVYTKNVYDYSKDFYLRVNPNIISYLNGNNNTISINGLSAGVKIATNNIITAVSLESENANALVITKRIVGTSPLTLIKTTANNYVIAKITNELGQAKTSQYFTITDNVLQLISGQEFKTSQTIYVSIYHYVSATTYYIANIFTVTITPDIAIMSSYLSNFVTYNGVQYLQLESDKEYTYDEIAANFTVSQDVPHNLAVSFEQTYVQSKTYWDISGSKIFLKKTTQILAGKLSVTVEIMGIATAYYPILIMPKLAPYVFYDTNANELITDDDERMDRNALANEDLASLLSIDYLVNNNIYDPIPDGLSYTDGFSILAAVERKFGLFLTANDTVLYSVLNGNGGYDGTGDATIYADGIITTNFVGNDTYIIVVASVNGINIYYRLRIVSSLTLESFYPYADNTSSSETPAEYILYKPTDSAKTITFSADFTDDIPASATKIDNVYNLTYNQNTKQNEYTLTNQNITNRIMMFRSILIEGNSNAKTIMNYAIQSITVKSIELGLMTDVSRTIVPSTNYSNYVSINIYEAQGIINVTLNNVTSYVVILEILTETNAKCEYTFAIEQTSRTYQIVEKTNETQFISEMPMLANDYSISIDSPAFNASEPSSVSNLENIYLRLINGVSTQDRTSILRYHVINNTNNLLTVENKTIYADYSVESVFASLLFYTKYGTVKQIPLTLETLVKIVDYNFDVAGYDGQAPITQKLSATIFANNRFDISNIIKFVQVEDSKASDVTYDWTKVEFEGGMPDYIELTDNVTTFVILPITENTTKQVIMNITVNINGLVFDFDFTLNINSSISSNSPTNLNLQPIGSFFANNPVELNVFGVSPAFFTNNGALIELTSLNNVITGSLEGSATLYNLNVTVISGTTAIMATRTIENGKLILQTNAVNDETQVILKADLIFVKGSYEFICTSYIAFLLKPDAILTFNYPAPDGTPLEFESIYYKNASVEFDKSASFQTPDNSRIVVTPTDGKDIASKNIYLTYKIVSGDPNLVVTGEVMPNETAKYTYSSNFTFDFLSSSSFSYATVDFEIYVSGISRGIYTLRVYKNISSVYGIKINYVNSVDGRNEVFYIGENRTDIFRGVQAFNYKINSLLASDVASIGIFKYTSEGIVNTGISFGLFVAEKGTNKTLEVATYNQKLDDLTNENIRFSINGSTNYLRLSQMTDYFALATSGDSAFTIVRRLVITYLGFEIYDDDFLSDISVADIYQTNLVTFSNYNIYLDLLGGNVTEITDTLVSIYVGNSTSSDNILGTYYYSVKVDLVVKNSADVVDILVGDEITKMLSVLGVSKRDGTEFVTYVNNAPVVDSNIISKNITFDLSFETQPENPSKPLLYYADTNAIYNHTATVEPIQYSPNRLLNSTLNEYYNYDFSILASGAPNASIVGKIIFTYTFKDVLNSGSKSYSFKQYINVKINPNWDITLYNDSGSENTSLTPQIINSDNFGLANEYDDTFADTRNSALTKVFAYRTNNIAAGNLAIGLKYTIIYPEITTGVATILQTNQEGSPIYKGINIQKPEFAIRTIQVKISDAYNYQVVYYYSVEPDTVITYNSITNFSDIYEGDTFILQYNGLNLASADVDHIIVLSSNVDSDVLVSYSLISDANGQDLNGINQVSGQTVAQSCSFKYIDGSLFTSGSVYVYLQIHLQRASSNEQYTINSGKFFLHQRYGAVVGNLNARDGYMTNLIDHVQITDYKENSNLGVPVLTNEKTLVIYDPLFVGSLKVSAYGSLYTAQIDASDLTKKDSEGLRYYMLSEAFSMSDIGTYNYAVTSIDQTLINSETLLPITAEDGTINRIQLNITTNNTLTLQEVGFTSGNAYLVHLCGLTTTSGVYVYQDILVRSGEDPVSLATYGSTNFGILGFRVSTDDDALAIQMQTNEASEQYVMISAINSMEFNITLTNTGSVVDNIKQLVIRQSSVAPYKAVTITDNKNNSYLGTISESNRIELQNGEYDFTGAGQNWIITSMSYNLANARLADYMIKSDKKLSIVTIKTLAEDGINYDSIDVLFNGENVKINVPLDQNGNQTFSLMEELQKGNDSLFVSSNYKLNSTNAIALSDLTKVKGMAYYNDTLLLTFGASDRTVNASMRLYRTRNNETIYYDFSTTLKPYKFSYSLGISKLFGDMVKAGDVYSLKVLSIGTATLTSLTALWPNGLAQTVTSAYASADFGNYTVSLSEIEIESGLTKVNIASQALYENEASSNLVTCPRYYIIKFKDAYYILDAISFKVSPYFYALDTSSVYSGESGAGQRIITDYSQRITSGQTSYVVAFDTWAKDINFLDSGLNVISGYNLISASNAGLIKFSLEEGGSGQGLLDEEKNLVTENIVPGLTYFTINVLVSLNATSTEEWLNIGSIIIGFSSNPQYFLEPLDENNNRIGYTIALDQTNTSGEVVSTLVRYFEITGSEPLTFSTNNLFKGENIDSYGLARTSTSNLHDVYLTDKKIHSYLVSYDETSATSMNYILQSSDINPDKKPLITAVNINNGDTVSFELTNGTNTYTASYSHTGNTLFGSINLGSILTNLKDINGNYYTLDNFPDLNNYTISTSNTHVSIVYTKLDITSLEGVLNTSFFGDGSSQNAIQGVIVSVDASKVFRISLVQDETSDISSVFVMVADRGSKSVNTEYYAITQFDLNSSLAQTYVYKAENSTTSAIRYEINLNLWNNTYFGTSGKSYTSIVIVEKLSSLDVFNGPTLFGLGGYYKHTFGTLQASVPNEAMDIIKYNSSSVLVKLDFSDEILQAFYNTSDDVSQVQPFIYTKILSSSFENVSVDLTLQTNQVLNIIRKTKDTNDIVTYVYEYYDQAVSTLTVSQNETLIILKSYSSGELIWNELTSLPLGVIYYATNQGGNYVAESPKTKITGLTNGTILGKLWNGTLSVDGNFNDDDYLQLSYGISTDSDFETVYFRYGDYKIANTNLIKVGELFKQNVEYMALNVDRFGLATLMTDNISNYVFASGIYLAKYDGNTYAIINYTNQTTSLFDLLADENITTLRSSKLNFVPKTTSELNWAVSETGYYSFSYNGLFKVVNLTSQTNYNLFTIFGVDILSRNDGSVEIRKLKNEIVIFDSADNNSVTELYVKIENATSAVKYLSVVYNPETLKYTVTLNMYSYTEFIMNLTSNEISYHQVADALGKEFDEGDENIIIVRNDSLSLVESA